MTRTNAVTSTATTAKTPRRRGAGRVRTVKVPLDVLATATAAELATMALPTPTAPEDKAAAAIALPDSMADMLGKAQAEEEAKRARRVRTAEPRVSLTEPQSAAMRAAGWPAPKESADLTVEPAHRTRVNPCKGGPVYTVAAQILTAGQPLHVADLAALWIAAGNQPKPMGAILKQVANRTGRTITQSGALIAV
jgi:hypothetical protein